MSGQVLLWATLTSAAATVTLTLRAAQAFRRVRAGSWGQGLAVLGARVRPQGIAQDALRVRLERAGLRDPRAVDIYLGARGIAMLIGLALALLLASQMRGLGAALFVGAAGIAAGTLAPPRYLALRAGRRRRAIERSFPTAVELLVVCMDAGLAFEHALGRVMIELEPREPVLADELRATLSELDAGCPFAMALRRLARRIDRDEVTSFCALVGHAAQLGAPLAPTLRAHVRSLRAQRAAGLDEHAGRMAARLALPVTLCLLPATMLLVLGPAILMALATLGGRP